MTLNCIHIFIVTGSFLYWCVIRPASVSSYTVVFIYDSLSYRFLALIAFLCVKQLINQLVLVLIFKAKFYWKPSLFHCIYICLMFNLRFSLNDIIVYSRMLYSLQMNLGFINNGNNFSQTIFVIKKVQVHDRNSYLKISTHWVLQNVHPHNVTYFSTLSPCPLIAKHPLA